MKRIFSFLLLACSTLAVAQTGITFGAYGGAMGVCFSGNCNAGSVSVQNLAITAAFSVEASQYIVPGANLQGYFAGISYALPTDKLLSKTQLPPNTFRLSLHGAPGIAINTASGASNRFGAFGGTEIDIAPTGDGKFVFGPRVDALYAPGFGSGPMGLAYSLNIGYLFGGTQATTPGGLVAHGGGRHVWGTKR